jgi:hypothetical protein
MLGEEKDNFNDTYEIIKPVLMIFNLSNQNHYVLS